MKKLFLLLILLITISVAIAQNTITIENHSYESIKVSIYHYEFNKWVYVYNYYISPNRYVTINIGDELINFYGYKKTNDYQVNQFYNDWIVLY